VTRFESPLNALSQSLLELGDTLVEFASLLSKLAPLLLGELNQLLGELLSLGCSVRSGRLLNTLRLGAGGCPSPV
jgi:hypothetical protein